ncbi:MAG TPA: bifunctional nicotinamidase/pyrazinamidase [Rhabdochlamydiaceae bacterium]|nr:bifunctional nicotinamidase/pyrazinamidase [Rhabdochlamydiaceae bacterium]
MKALLIVDMQNDFMPGGALPVPHGNALIPIINRLIPHFSHVIATQDWHPKDHVSFASNHPGKKPGDLIEVKGIKQILWPVHCVRNTKGAELVAGLKKESIASIFYKGSDKWVDSYSAFFDNARLRATGLEEYLKTRGINELYIAGVATDYCVLYSVLDALELGFKISVIQNACRGIDLKPHDEERALQKMEENGAVLISSAQLQ